ncbi:hypothetical protein [Motiliproteus sp. SC1-56]|uniref:hypothetical protein n=1 Tax=Motiliproteus sp. SC1-56 TaxID=2799565 RepID=UPI001A9066CB|nr:hypothetical protein [Motiliproteus sp. SC1-56]
MRIDSSFNFPQLPQRPQGVTARPDPRPEPAGPAETQKNDGRSRTRFFEPVQPEGASRQEQSRFYSTDRELPLRSQEAISLYHTTASFKSGAGTGELVGVDIYV